jgi:hypothetical protein
MTENTDHNLREETMKYQASRRSVLVQSAIMLAGLLTVTSGAAKADVRWCLWIMAKSLKWRRPKMFFSDPQHQRTKIFLSQILAH